MKPKLVYFESIDPFSSSINDEAAGEEAGAAGAGRWYDMGGAGWKVALAAVYDVFLVGGARLWVEVGR